MRVGTAIAAVALALLLAPDLAPPSAAEALARSSGGVVLTFDDGCASLPQVATALEARGWRGTFFVMSDPAHASVDCPLLTPGEVARLASRGHDVEAHSVTHPHLTAIPSADATAQIERSQLALTNLVGRKVTHFAYPYGETDASVTSHVASRYATGRLYYSDFDAMPLDMSIPSLLPSIGVLDTTTTSDVSAWIDAAHAQGVVLILTFHDITEAPERYETTPARFAAILDLLRDRNERVMTMAEAFGSTSAVRFAPSSSGNEWWAQVSISGADAAAVTGVEARDDGGAWVALAKKSFGWAASFRVEPGHRVAYRATLADGRSVESCAFKHPAGPCDGLLDVGPTPAPPPPVSSSFTATFKNVRGNEWWVETDVTASGGTLAGIDARVDGGAWAGLAKRSYGSWAKSLHVGSGSHVEFRARASDGATALSSVYTWPPR